MLKKSNVVRKYKAALIGNPNAGKSTLFNCLTGATQQIGNWPGVTVEQKTGKFIDNEVAVQLIDLPGCYSLIATEGMSADEKITCEFIAQADDTLFINIVDAAHLQRDLYLTLQLLELGKPVIIALNCMDLARKANIEIACDKLAKHLGCSVIPISAKSSENISVLQKQIILNCAAAAPSNAINLNLPPALQDTLQHLQQYVTRGQAIHVLEGDILYKAALLAAGLDITAMLQAVNNVDQPLDLIIAKQRRIILQDLINSCVTVHGKDQISFSKRIDKIVLHKIFGPIIFAAVMYTMFTFAINLGGFLQQGFDQTSEAIFIVAFGKWLMSVGAAPWLTNILAYGIGKGINITVTFIPVLIAMFLSLGILESSGYMTRAAFIVDRLMRVIGLPGKAFVPMIVGFGCNVPAVMGARTLNNRYERILTIMMIPFMSCSARLAIYAIFVTTFFPIGGQNVIFSLYLVGILVAILTGLALRSAMLPQQSTSLIDMPDYRLPTLRILLRQVWNRLKSFLLKASGLIIVLCILINGIGYHNLEIIGKKITPIFKPIGISEENWPATVGLVTGLLAKEAVIGTLNSVYSVAAGVTDIQVAENTLSKAAENEMLVRFGGTTAAYAYLLFTLLYFPCVSVVAVIARELNKRWAMFAVIWTTALAYIVAALYYQIATWPGINSSATIWICSLTTVLMAMYYFARTTLQRSSRSAAKYKPVPTIVTITQ